MQQCWSLREVTLIDAYAMSHVLYTLSVMAVQMVYHTEPQSACWKMTPTAQGLQANMVVCCTAVLHKTGTEQMFKFFLYQSTAEYISSALTTKHTR